VVFLIPWLEGFPIEGIDRVGALKTLFCALVLHFHYPSFKNLKVQNSGQAIALTTTWFSQKVFILPFLFSQEGQSFRKQ